MKAFVAASAVFIGLAGCASLTEKAAKIQVHSQMSTLLTACKVLGPVSANVSDPWLGRASAISKAKIKVREETADKGGDTIVITNTDTFIGESATVQGTALRCY